MKITSSQDVEALGSAGSAREKRSLMGGGMPRLNILLADDFEFNQDVITPVLEKEGHAVRVVVNGKQAVEAVSEETFDLVLMDIRMPEMDGVEAVRRNRALSDATKAGVPVIALTAHAVKGDRERFLKAGMDDYIAKPLRSPELLSTIRRVLHAAGKLPAISSKSTEPSLDLNHALSNMEGNQKVLLKSCRTILRVVPDTLEKMDDACSKGDVATFERLAHSIKTAAKNINARKVADFAFQMEQASSRGQIERIKRELPGFKELTRQMLVDLESELAGWFGTDK